MYMCVYIYIYISLYTYIYIYIQITCLRLHPPPSGGAFLAAALRGEALQPFSNDNDNQ